MISVSDNYNPPETTGVFFQHSTIVKQWHGLSATGTLTGKERVKVFSVTVFSQLSKFASGVGFGVHSQTFPGY